MVKANSHHGLDRKYKPWRRGKSQNAKAKKGSLKQQLRGLQRLLPKARDETHRESIQSQIQELQTQISEKQALEQQKQNARKSHGVRFLERQRLTRLWQQAAKLDDEKKRQREQHRIGLDMLYVAHYPLQVRYQPLFRKNERILLDGRNLARRAASRAKILQSVATLPRASWIPAHVYDQVPAEWSNALERQTFGVVQPHGEGPVVTDDRFTQQAQQQQHESILQAAEAMDKALDAEEAVQEESEGDRKETAGERGFDDDDRSSSSSGGVASDDEEDDDEDDADPLARQDKVQRKRPVGDAVPEKPFNQEEEEEEEEKPACKNPVLEGEQEKVNSSSSDDDSSSSSDDDSSSSDATEGEHEDSTKPLQTHDEILSKFSKNHDDDKDDKNDDDDDDFLMAPEEAPPDTQDIFAHAKETVPSIDQARGDKSQGWSTQRQRPGQFKKRRTRR